MTAFGTTDFRGDSARFTVPLVVYDGAPHAVPLTHAERLNADLPAFPEG